MQPRFVGNHHPFLRWNHKSPQRRSLPRSLSFPIHDLEVLILVKQQPQVFEIPADSASNLVRVEAFRMGEVQKVASDARQALEAGIRIASKVADCGPLGIKTSLTSAHLAIDQNEEEALSKLDGPLRALFHTQEFLEGRKAEAEGRKPVYRGNDHKSKQHATDSVSSKDKQ
jgi:hypothetical protein